MRGSKCFLAIVVGSVVVFLAASVRAEEWQTVYSTDFSSNPFPDWTTNDPTNLNWDESGDRLHVKFINGADQYIYRNVPYSSNASYKLEFDITLTHMDDAGFAMFGMSDATMNAYEPATWYTCYSKDLDTAVSLQYASDTIPFKAVGGGGNRYDLNTEYHTVLTYDRSSQTISLDIASGGVAAFHFSGSAGTFTGIDRLGGVGIGVENAPMMYGEGYIDNVVFLTVPEPSTIVLLGIGAASLFGYARRRRRVA